MSNLKRNSKEPPHLDIIKRTIYVDRNEGEFIF